MRIDFPRSGIILAYFALGWAAINMCFVLMYRHALKKAETLELSSTELVLTRGSLAMYIFMTALFLVVAAICGLTPVYGFGGCLFFLNWPFGVWVGRKYNPEKHVNV